MRPLKIVLIILLSVCLSSCLSQKTGTINRSFYYWKSSFKLTGSEVETLRKLEINRMYIKFFDVVWSNGPVPVSQTRFISNPPSFLAIVPTVFITNETLKKLSVKGVPDLAEKIEYKISQMLVRNEIGLIPEIQLDCDWTLDTRAKYFELLQLLRTKLNGRKIALSATLRLHQVKYRRQTGIPPVDRGMLMFYNLAPVTSFTTKNSIIDLEIGKSYTGALDTYPLPLDLALPIFSWGVVFQDNRFICLAGNLRREDILNNPNFETYRGNYLRVKTNIYLRETQLYRGDLLRVEESDYRICRQSAVYLADKLPESKEFTVALFHFDPENLRGYGDEGLKSLFAAFR